MIPQSFIDDLLNRVDIVDVVGNYVKLKKGGANFMGLCPFHSEKSPSFTVSPTKQFYHCFGCGAHGSAISFLIEYSGLAFPEAVRDLAQSAGMTVPDDGVRTNNYAGQGSHNGQNHDAHGMPGEPYEGQQGVGSVALADVMARALDYYRHQLRGAPRAIHYLKGRGLSGEIAARFGLGYAPDGWRNLEQAFSDYEDPALVESGLVIDREGEDGARKHYDRFRDRVMFPIRNTKGKVIGFGGRIIDAGEPKYLNSPETPLFNKGSELYGLFEARQAIREAECVIVVEGYMDVVALAQLGVPNAVATLGTACTNTHVQKLTRQTDRIVFSFDGDAAGRRAAWRALEASLPFAADSKAFSFLFLPTEHDPDSYIREFGKEGFAAAVSTAMPLSAFLLRELAQDISTAEGRARMLFEAKPHLQALPNGALRMQILRELAKLAQSSPEEIMVLAELPRTTGTRAPQRVGRTAPTPLETQVMRTLLAFPQLAAALDEDSQQALTRLEYPPLAELLHLCSGSPNASFASVSEALLAGPEADAVRELVPQVLEFSEMTVETARQMLNDAILRLRDQQIRAELERMISSGKMDADSAVRYRELQAQQSRLRAAAQLKS